MNRATQLNQWDLAGMVSNIEHYAKKHGLPKPAITQLKKAQKRCAKGNWPTHKKLAARIQALIKSSSTSAKKPSTKPQSDAKKPTTKARKSTAGGNKTGGKKPVGKQGRKTSQRTRMFELSDGKSNKFWEITVSGSSFTTRFGRIGTDGQLKSKSFADAAACQAQADRLIGQKTRKGYAEV